ncbi:hypothetical protein CB0940_08580 [Cercospora beticola]|uniref:Amidoligase enzyme n=1 Tax=Cercospora beticola TaxID=122368 RepID=A0A2G5HRJ6_CERBT|nr:hypothetical protein CB0940_08580 [Cercospora beticola]PIA94852.1 hypothetical protein CB0940_08580 [Cercospora beticola]WPB05157.1 hypothetical protein RHO25_009807 [Cercospora beticola]
MNPSESGKLDPNDPQYESSEEFKALSEKEQEPLLDNWQRQYDDEESASVAGPLDLTLGVEIECVLLQNKLIDSRLPLNEQEIWLGQEVIHAALCKPMKIVCGKCCDVHEWQLPLNEVGGEWLEGGCEPNYDNWTVGTDLLHVKTLLDKAFIPDFDKFNEYGLEVRSRILHVAGHNIKADQRSDCQYRPEISYQDEIRAVYERLHEEFLNPNLSAEEKAWRLFSNHSCGLHVHIGNGGPHRRLPLRVVKNILNLHLANERQIDNLHSSTRIDGSALLTGGPHQPNDQEVKNCPESSHFIKMADRAKIGLPTSIDPDQLRYPANQFSRNRSIEQDARSMNIPAWNRIIASAKTLNDLHDIHWDAMKWCVVNISHTQRPVAGEKKQPKQTIEFRQAVGTLDYTETLAWIDVLVKLVKYADSKSPQNVLEICENIWMSPMWSTLDFLDMLGLKKKDETFKHYKHVLGLRSRAAQYGDFDHFAAESFAKELRLAETFGREDFFYEIMKFFAAMKFGEKRPDTVNQRIHEKFMTGGYGQFEKTFLRNFAHDEDWYYDGVPKNVLQGRLLVGWKLHDPIPDDPLADPEDDEDE